MSRNVLTCMIHPYDALTSNMYGSLSHKGVTLLVSSSISSSSRGFGTNPLGNNDTLWSLFLFGVAAAVASSCTEGGVDVSVTVVVMGVGFFSVVLVVVMLSSS